ncbi:hypothetical protein [Amaricoccus sp. W119]|uniref:hypothetical protein n=1 Tax=Amaricoccus sp. W119 TaxID=3391833 RepID=UPI0039A4D029
MPTTLSLTVTVDCDPGTVLGGPDKVAVLALFLDEDGFCHLTASDERHGALRYPESVRYFRDLVWRQVLPRGVEVSADPEKIDALARALRPWLARVHAGHSIEPRDGVLIGQLTPDAAEASRRVQRLHGAADWIARDQG